MAGDSVAAVTGALAARTGTDARDWYLVFKARYGLEVVMRALRAHGGAGDVVSQVFTCSTAVDPILVAGLTPVYAEVSPETIAIDPDRLTVGAETRAVMLQHTFGIVDPQRARRLAAAAHGAGALVIEDSAHCVGTMARDESGQPVADVSVHSFGVEKMIPGTRFGGAVWVSPSLEPSLRAEIIDTLGSLPVVGGRADVAARAYRSQVRVLSRIGPLAGPVRRALMAVRLHEPPVAPAENRGELAHPAMAPSAWMTALMADGLASLGAVEERRGAAVAEYVNTLAGHVELPAAIGNGAPLARFPLFVADTATAERCLAALRDHGHYGGRWYRPALFPGVDDPAVYGYVPGDGSLAVTEDLISRVVNLPTNVSREAAREAAAVVLDVIRAGGSS